MPSAIAIPQPHSTDLRPTSAGAVTLWAVLGLVAFRVALAILDRTELSTDEAQYWFWGQQLEFGAYSKPPLIGWILRLSTDLMGQTVWAVRLPAVLLHGLTAAVIYFFARRIAPQPVPMLAALCYLTMPAVALGSAVMTTDTPMLLAAAVALFAQAQAGDANTIGGRAPLAAVALGLALGLGLLAKYAMLFWLVGGVAAATLLPAWRPARADLLLAAGVMLAVIAPHLTWLYRHGFITLLHVQDISRGESLSLLRPLRFLAEQFLVAGPVLFAAMVLAVRRNERAAGLAILALAPLLIILAQSVKGPVLANWAVLYLVPGSVLGALWLARHRRLAQVSLLLGLVVSLALPLLKTFGTDLQRPDGRLLLSRYLGHSGTANWVVEAALASGARTLVAQDRDLLADLSWFAVGSGLAIRAVPPQGRPAHHWEMSVAFDPQTDATPLLLLLRDGTALSCPDAEEISRRVAEPGFAGGETFLLYRLPDPACLSAARSMK